MREESSGKVAELTDRRVLAMMNTNHIDPDLAAEIYVLTGRRITQPFSPKSPPTATVARAMTVSL